MKQVPVGLVADDLIPDREIESAADDKLGHHSLARVVADTVRNARPPLNIALFGAWGSGKSSFYRLLHEELAPERKHETIELVRYDAWKFQDGALQRHFIAEVAEGLGVSVPDLYSSEESKRVDPSGFDRQRLWRLARWTVSWALPLAVIGAVFLIVVAGITSWVGKPSFETELRRFALGFIAVAGGVAFLGAVARVLLDDVLLTRRRDAPAEEELDAAFKSVLASAREKNTKPSLARRLSFWRAEESKNLKFVLFVDELDRCSQQEVVATLSAIKNFLGHEDCIFIVAADRDVLEEALKEALPQTNPVNVEAPYYSSASEFLDKVFYSCQLSFPPLREQRRAWFARELVLRRQAGLWHELREEDGGRLLDDIIFVLIPGHVQSPRRIKVLLSSFALNCRLAESRGMQWAPRATEIAKLTVLQTEFPLLARDLPTEPRLPALLLNPSWDDLPPRTIDLLNRHKLPPEPTPTHTSQQEQGLSEAGGEATPEPQTKSTETDTLLVDDADRAKLAHVQREQLRRYLDSRKDYPNPRRDLLYLESIGAVVELDDADLADRLETESGERPERVRAALENRDDDTRNKSARILASLLPQSFGRLKQNTVRSLFFCLELLPSPDEQTATQVADTLSGFVTVPELEEQELVTALRIGIAAHHEQLTARVMSDDRLLDDADRVKAVALMSELLSTGQQKKVADAVADYYVDDEDVLFEPLETLPEPHAVKLLDATFDKTVGKSFADEEEGAVEAGQRLFASLKGREPRPDLLLLALRYLVALRDGTALVVIRAVAADVLALPPNQSSRTEVALEILEQASSGEWEDWIETAETRPVANASELEESVASAISSMIQHFTSAALDQQDRAPDLLRRVLKLAPRVAQEDAAVASMADTVIKATADSAVWADPVEAQTRIRLHRAVRALTTPRNSALAIAVEKTLLADLERGVSAPGDTVESVAEGAVLGSSATMKVIATSLYEQVEASDTRMRALLRLAATVAGKDGPSALTGLPAFSFDADDVIRLSVEPDSSVLADWLATQPPVTQVVRAAQELKSARVPIVPTFAAWGEGQSPETRSHLLIGLIDVHSTPKRWLQGFADQTLDEVALVDRLTALLGDTTRHDERKRLAQTLTELRLDDVAAETRAADFVLALLKQKTKADFDTALKTIHVIGDQHGKGQELARELKRCSNKLQKKVPRRFADDLQATSVSIPESFFEKPKGGLLSKVLG